MSYLYAERKIAVVGEVHVVSSHYAQHRHHHQQALMAFANPQHDQKQSVEESEFAEYIWNGVKPYAMRLRDIIMHNPLVTSIPFPPFASFPPPTPPGLTTPPKRASRPAMPPLSMRRAACTHITMERLYGSYHCSVCDHSSDLGWVYCCTQDDFEEDFAAQWTKTRASPAGPSATEGDHHPSINSEPNHPPEAPLSSWMEKAIKEGHYTSEQEAHLRAQRQKAVNTAHAALTKWSLEQTPKRTQSIAGASRTNNENTPSKSTTLPSLDQVRKTPDPPSSSGGGGHGSNNPSQQQQSPQPPPTPPGPEPSLFPYCKTLACQTCRPTYRDRAWLSFQDAWHYDDAPSLAGLGRDAYAAPFASRALMQNIGLGFGLGLGGGVRKRGQGSGSGRGRDDVGGKESGDMGSGRRDGVAIGEADVADESAGTEESSSSSESGSGSGSERGGLKQSVRRVLRGILQGRGGPLPLRASSSPHALGLRVVGADGGLGSRSASVFTLDDAEDADLGLLHHHRSSDGRGKDGDRGRDVEVLDEAAQALLPAEEEMEEEASNPAPKNVKGVAVMEESVGFGMADVILGV